MGNYILIGIGIFLILMILIGLKRGLIKMLFSFGMLFIILSLVSILTPITRHALNESGLRGDITKRVEKYVDEKIDDSTKDMTDTGVGAQKKIIEDLPLPKTITNNLIKGNNQESYDLLNVTTFRDYIVKSLTDLIMGAISFLFLFLTLAIVIKVIVSILDIISKLPVIKTFNAIGGALLGLAIGVMVVWVLCMCVTAISTTELGQKICKEISQNAMLSYIYDNNMLQRIVTSLLS